jgi:acyl-CoA synthetase (AMP-forming)/AMP-acid ligase II
MIFSLDEHSSAKALYEASAQRWWSYADLRDSVESSLRAFTGSSKPLIFNFCRNDIRSIVTYLAALESGSAVALLDDGLASEAKIDLIDLYQPDFISTGVDVPSPGYEPVRELLWRRTVPSNLPLHPDLALLLSTSGSTGSPRFVRLTRRNVEANAESISQVLAIEPSDCAITSLPIHYSYGLSVLNTHLLRGAAIALSDQGLLEPGFWQTFRAAECTSLAGVPYLYQILKRLDPDRLNIPSLNTLTQAGGKLQPDLIAKFSSWISGRGGRFFVMYGQTEATARISILPPAFLPAKLGSVGTPLPGGQAFIRIDDEMTAEPNRSGELVYRGPNVMMGYAASREDLALGDVTGGVLSTGDMAYMDEDGFLFITGRTKRDAKLFGLRINLDEVESMLRIHGPVAVVSKGEKLRIFCEHGDDEVFAVYQRELAARLRIHFAAFAFERIEKIPVTSSGKIDYQNLVGLP